MTKIILQSTGYEVVPLFARKIVYYYGLTAINWGKLEQLLDVLLYTVNSPDTEYYVDIPNTSFKGKCELFKKWFVKDPRFSEFHGSAARLHRSLMSAAKDRQMLFHSSVQDFLRGDPHSVELVNLQHDNKLKKIRLTRGKLNQLQIESAAIRIARLSHGMKELHKGISRPEFIEALHRRT